jgi:DNA repair protein RecO
MNPIKDLAIVLRSVAYEERHKVVTALTQGHGQITALAKNSIHSRRFGGVLEPFVASEWHFSAKPGAELYQLTEAHLREPFDGLRKDYGKLCLGSTLSEVMLRLAPHQQPCLELFKLHSNALSLLSKHDLKGKELLLLNAYLGKLLQWSGSQPRLQSCVQCSLPLEDVPLDMELTCIISQAGWICEDCRLAETKHVRERDANHKLEHSLLRIRSQALQFFLLSLRLPIREIVLSSQAEPRSQHDLSDTSNDLKDSPLGAKIRLALLASIEDHSDLYRLIKALYLYHVPGFDKSPLKTLRFLESSLLRPEVSRTH